MEKTVHLHDPCQSPFSHFLPEKKWGLRSMGLYGTLEAGQLKGLQRFGGTEGIITISRLF